jgi:hypothetical protein
MLLTPSKQWQSNVWLSRWPLTRALLHGPRIWTYVDQNTPECPRVYRSVFVYTAVSLYLQTCIPKQIAPSRCTLVHATLHSHSRPRVLQRRQPEMPLEYGRCGGADLDGCEGSHGRGELGRCEGRGRRESRGGSMATRARRSCRLETLLTASTHTCRSYCQNQSVTCPLTGDKRRQAVRWRLSGRTCLCSTLRAYSTLPKPRW